MPDSKQIPLKKLLDKKEIAALLGEFENLIPGYCLSLLGEDGLSLVGNNLSLKELNTTLGEARNGKIIEREDALIQPLVFESQIKGALVAKRNNQATVPVSNSEVQHVLICLDRTITLLLTKAIETRDVVDETVERYREINLLYHIGETIGTCLDPQKIPGLVLQEANRCIPVEVGIVLLVSDDKVNGTKNNDFQVKASIGTTDHINALHRISRKTIDKVLETKHPAIDTNLLALQSFPEENRKFTAVLCVPFLVGDRIMGMIVLGRLSEQKMFSAGDMKLLMALASQASIALETVRLHLEEIKKQRLEDELDFSRQIQLSLLPKKPPTITGWEFAALYQAAHQVGGDLYDFIRLPNQPDKVGLLIADVAGKGIPAALFMAFCRTIIRLEAMSEGTPEEILKRTNQLILQNSRTDLFLTAFYALLDFQNGELVFANGGHNPPIWFQAAKGECEKLISKSALLGLFNNISTEEHRIKIAPGDLLVFYTDGITEARATDGEFFGEARLLSSIMSNKEAGAQVVLQAIFDETNEFIGNSPQSDDFTLFVIKRKKELV